MARAENQLLPAGWQPIALSTAITAKQPVARSILGQAIVLFRDANNQVRALEDRCAHRRAPLSLGRITEQGSIQCPYHGWTYEGRQGKCTDIPNLSAKESVPGQYQVGSFKTAEVGGLIFVADSVSRDSCQPSFSTNSADQPLQEGSAMVTLATPHLLAALVDCPSVLLNFRQVTLIDDHLLGEPSFSEGKLSVERVADWTPQARRRKKVASDYPLILRIELDLSHQLACIQLIDDNETELMTVWLGCSAASAAVTSMLWRSVKRSTVPEDYSKTASAAFNQLAFEVHPAVDAAALLASHPYVSSIMNGSMLAAGSMAHANLEG